VTVRLECSTGSTVADLKLQGTTGELEGGGAQRAAVQGGRDIFCVLTDQGEGAGVARGDVLRV
jgi:hypothetical protein